MPKRRVRQRRQRGGFLNRYDIVYAERDTINSTLNNFKIIVPGFIENVRIKIDKDNEKKNCANNKSGRKRS